MPLKVLGVTVLHFVDIFLSFEDWHVRFVVFLFHFL
jgi:hypothetical protein